MTCARVLAAAKRALTRDPVLTALALALAGALVAMAVVRARDARREGWTFEGRVSELTKSHHDFVWKKCSTGTTWGQLISNPEWDYLGKYPAAKVIDVCIRALSSAKTDARDRSEREGDRGAPSGKGASAFCGANRSACPSSSLRERRPCTNTTGDKCCAWDGNNVSQCVKIDGNIDARWAPVVNSKAGDCSRAACPESKLRGDYPCLHSEGKKCCNGVSGKCKTMSVLYHQANLVNPVPVPSNE